MGDLAKWIARILWWQMLMVMRLPWVRKVRRWWLRHVPRSTAERMIRQDRFARKHGQTVLAVSITIMLASFALTGCYFLALEFLSSGLFHGNPPR